MMESLPDLALGAETLNAVDIFRLAILLLKSVIRGMGRRSLHSLTLTASVILS